MTERARAHGNLDQYLAGDPGCNATNFPQSAALDGTLRQEFVPSGASLSSISVCLQSTAASGTLVSVGVREGSASSPGALVGALNVTAPAGATTYVHADFPAPLSVAAGDSYVIEIAPASGLIVWRGAPDGVDWYAAGQSSTAISDLAFRSYIVPAAPTSTHTPTNSPPAVTSTAGPTQTPTKSPTRTPTRTPAATSTSTRVITATPPPLATAPAVAAATLPNIVYADTGAPSTPRGGATSAPAGSTGESGAGGAAVAATPQASTPPSGVVLAAATRPARDDGTGVTVNASEGDGGRPWGVIIVALIGVPALLGGGAYGVWRWRMRE